jgi:site-specific DNA-methyltransferase (adenine-specific)
MDFQLFNADCLEKMKDISSNSVDLILCDLPFGCLAGVTRNQKEHSLGQGNYYIKDGKETFGCSWDIPIDLEKFWKEIRRIRKDDHTPTLHFCSTRYGYELIKSNEKEFRYDLVWDKNRGVSFLSVNKMPMRSHEMIYVFSKAGASYNRVDISGNFPAGGGGGRKNGNVYGDVGEPHKTPAGRRCVLSVIPSSWKDSKKSGKHPTEKPIELYKFLIERYCPPGGIVLDPTFGSGNSGLACKQLGRKYIGIEKDKTFFDKFNAVTKN